MPPRSRFKLATGYSKTFFSSSVPTRLAKIAETRQTSAQFNSPPIGGSIDSQSLSDAYDQEKETSREEAPRRGRHAGEEGEEAEEDDAILKI
jgi:hypothetical protein